MKIDPAHRDIAIHIALGAGAMFGGFAFAEAFLPSRWTALFVFACMFAAIAVEKLLMPNHLIMRLVPWAYFISVCALWLTGVWLLSDWSVLGFFYTIPAVVGLGLILAIVHFVFARKDDGDAEKH